jgi:hypothetical protein
MPLSAFRLRSPINDDRRLHCVKKMGWLMVLGSGGSHALCRIREWMVVGVDSYVTLQKSGPEPVYSQRKQKTSSLRVPVEIDLL